MLDHVRHSAYARITGFRFKGVISAACALALKLCYVRGHPW